MVGLVFHYEDEGVDVFSGCIRSLDPWNYACKVGGGFDRVRVVNKTEQVLTPFDVNMDFAFVEDYDELNLDGVVAQFTTPWSPGTHVPLSSLDHALVDWYVFGPASGWNAPVNGVYLPQAGTGACHATHVFSATMFDRYGRLNP